MANKTLSTKRVFAFAIYNALRNTAPKDYPTTAEIKSTISDVLPALKLHVEQYVTLQKRAIEIGESIAGNDAAAKAADPQIQAVQDEWKKYTKEHGSDIVGVELETEAFKTLKAQFNRDEWGTKWLASIEEFGELLAAFEAAEK